MNNKNQLHLRFTALLLLLVLILFSAIVLAEKPDSSRSKICGVKAYFNFGDTKAQYPNYNILIDDLKHAGVNALFTTLYEGKQAFYKSDILPSRDTTIDMNKLRALAQKKGVLFGTICQIFYDPDIIEQRRDLIPIDQNGDTSYVNWQKLICPTDKAYRSYKLSIVKEIAATVHPDIISLDFIRYPATWELIPRNTAPKDLRNFCFCNRCLSQFQKTYALVIPENLRTIPQKAQWILHNHRVTWEQWKAANITSFVQEARREIKAIDPTIKVSIHLIPWSERTFQNALLWIVGQDVTALAEYTDYFSPMIYHKLIGFPNDYIHTLTSELYEKTQKSILPSIQTAQIDSEGDISPEEFQQSLNFAFLSPSCGTLIFCWDDLFMRENATPSIRSEKNKILQTIFEKQK
jgi:uncharacterized lipoprotein YddW (UPF0748 family)